jgi:hypothetical protein
MRMLYKIDNSHSMADVKYVSVRLIRQIKFRKETDFALCLDENTVKFILFDKLYSGIASGKAHPSYAREILIDLAQIFGLDKLKRLREQPLTSFK